MTIQVEKLPDEPIIVATFTNPMNYYAELPVMFNRIIELRDTLVGYAKYYVIIDISRVTADFSEIVFALGEVRKASQKRRADLPISLHMVGVGEIVQMIVNAMPQFQYGGYVAPLYSTLEQALEAIRKDIRSRA